MRRLAAGEKENKHHASKTLNSDAAGYGDSSAQWALAQLEVCGRQHAAVAACPALPRPTCAMYSSSVSGKLCCSRYFHLGRQVERCGGCFSKRQLIGVGLQEQGTCSARMAHT